jgi:hypothetical protein
VVGTGRQCDQMIRKKAAQLLEKVAKKSQNIYIKVSVKIPKHKHQTSFETQKYLQQTIL